MTVHIYRCPVCHYEIEVTIAQSYNCPACAKKMYYVTSRPKKD